MTTYRGMDGFLSFGGVLVATAGPLVNGALIAGATSLNLDGTNLTGVLVTGDTFTLAGEAGTPVHTVTGGPYVAAGNAIAGVTFTPAIAAGGVADNAAISFTTNSVSEARLWNVNASKATLDTTKLGDQWQGNRGGIASWSGSGEAFLDYGDPRQAAMIDRLLSATPSADVPGVLFGTGSRKQWYAAAVLTGLTIAGAAVGELFRVTFTFTGSGSLLPNWN